MIITSVNIMKLHICLIGRPFLNERHSALTSDLQRLNPSAFCVCNCISCMFVGKVKKFINNWRKNVFSFFCYLYCYTIDNIAWMHIRNLYKRTRQANRIYSQIQKRKLRHCIYSNHPALFYRAYICRAKDSSRIIFRNQQDDGFDCFTL